MSKIPIYKNERADGLETIITASASVAYAARLDISTTPFPANVNVNLATATNENQVDLYYLHSLLVTTGWNLNDDIFDKVETWLARNSPEDKPFNLEHKPSQVIGHITGNHAQDDNGKKIDDGVAIDDLPAKYHIITSAVLYKFLNSPEPEIEEKMRQIIAQVKEGKWYVSMEALFTNFDYGVVEANNKQVIIPRNEESSFLTKHLKAYGGKGVYNDRKIGRLMRNITFSGKGLVAEPANPQSKIFNSTAEFSGYVKVIEKENIIMASEVDILQGEVKRLEASVKAATDKNGEYEKQLKELGAKQIEAKLADLESQIKSRDDKLAALASQVKTEQDARTSAEAKLKDVSEKLASTEKTLADAAALAVKHARVEAWVKQTGVDVAIATKSVDNLAKLNDEEFNNFVGIQTKVVTTPPVVKPQTESEKADAAKKALENAKPDETNSSLGTAGVNNDTVEQTRAALSKYITSNYLRARGSKKGDE